MYRKHVFWRQTQDFDYQAHLLVLVLAAEEGEAQVKLSYDASEAPDVYFAVVGKPEDYLRGAVVSALDVGVNGLTLEAAGAEVDDLDA